MPVIHLWRKLQMLAKYPQNTLVAEIQRLALFAPESLKKELEPNPHPLINRLPDDILSDIFLVLLDVHGDNGYFEKPEGYQGLISLVCHRWKVVIESTPLAWAAITVSDRQPFPITKRFLRLSGNRLINITVPWTISPLEHEHATLVAYDVNEISCLFGLLWPEAHRWRNLFVDVKSYSLILYVVQGLQSVAAPNLRILWLSSNNDDEAEGLTLPVKYKFFQSPPGAPLLRDVTLWGVHIDWSSPFLSSHLRKLTLRYHDINVRPEPRRFFEILSSCSETLQVLALERSGPILDDVDVHLGVSSKIELPNLRVLKMAFLSVATARRMFGIIVARDVKKLTFNFGNRRLSVHEWNEFIKEICTGGISSKEQMFPALTSLYLLSFPAQTNHLGALLFYHPRITSLTINFDAIDSHLLDTLGSPIPKIGVPYWATTLLQCIHKLRTGDQTADENVRHKEWLCPELRNLKVNGVGGGQLRLLVARRKEGGVPLKEVSYPDTCGLGTSYRVWLKANLKVLREFKYIRGDDGGDDGNYGDDDKADKDD